MSSIMAKAKPDGGQTGVAFENWNCNIRLSFPKMKYTAAVNRFSSRSLLRERSIPGLNISHCILLMIMIFYLKIKIMASLFISGPPVINDRI